MQFDTPYFASKSAAGVEAISARTSNGRGCLTRVGITGGQRGPCPTLVPERNTIVFACLAFGSLAVPVRRRLWLLAVTFLCVAIELTANQFATASNISAYAVASASAISPSDEYLDSAFLFHHAFASAESRINFSNEDVLINGIAFAIASSGRNSLGAKASVLGIDTGPVAEASAQWNDNVRLISQPGVPIFNDLNAFTVQVTVHIHGQVNVEGLHVTIPYSGQVLANSARASGSFTVFDKSFFLNKSVANQDGVPVTDSGSLDETVLVLISGSRADVGLTQDGREFFTIPWNLSVGVSASAGNGSALADFGNTLTVQSITLADFGGATPESMGYSVTFDSGAPSPNVVPEPSTAALALLGGIALLMQFRHG